MNRTTGQRTVGTTLMAGWTLLGLFLAGQLPFFGAILLALAGLPAILVVLAWGAAWFLLYGALILSVTTVVASPVHAALLMPMVLVPAGLLAGALQARLTPMRAIGTALAAACLFSVALWAVAPLLGRSGTELWGIQRYFQQQSVQIENQLREFNKEAKGDDQQLELVIEQVRGWSDFLTLLFPVTFVFVWHLISLGVFYVGALILASRFGFTLEPLPQFSSWRFDWNLIWLFLAGWLLFHGADTIQSLEFQRLFRVVGANCLAISKILYFILGFSLVFFFFEMYQISLPNRLGLSFLALLLSQLLVWLGIIDVWADFRAPKPAIPARRDADDDGDSFFDQF